MKKFDRRGKILPVLLIAAIISFTLTGVAESAVSGIDDAKNNAAGFIKGVARLGAYMAIPSNGIILPIQNEPSSPTAGDSFSIKEDTSDINTSLPEQSEPDSADIKPDESDKTESISSEQDEPDGEELELPEEEHSKSLLISKNITAEYQSPDDYNAKSGRIKEQTYGKITGDTVVDLEYGQIKNLTSFSANEVKKAAIAPPEFSNDGAPKVLIIHTHTTEAYELNYDDGYYDENFNGRTLDPGYSVVGVGAAMAQALADNGIGVVHDGTLFDEPLYNGAYDRSAERIKELLEEFPTIEVVIDLHRDGIADGDVRIAPVADISGEKAAQVMIICGADDGSNTLPNHLKNLGFAGALQQTAEQMYPGLTRPLLYDYRLYNQDLGHYNILIEAGAFGNSPEQARLSGTLMGNALAKVIKENS